MTYLIPCVKDHNIICSKVILSKISRNFFNLKNIKLKDENIVEASLYLYRKNAGYVASGFTSCQGDAYHWHGL